MDTLEPEIHRVERPLYEGKECDINTIFMITDIYVKRLCEPAPKYTKNLHSFPQPVFHVTIKRGFYLSTEF